MLDGSLYIVVPNWDRYQHYRDRSPAWIKLHLSVLDHDELSTFDQGLWCLLLLLYARNGRVVSIQRAAKTFGNRNVRRSLQRLNDAGLIEFSASKPLAQVLPQRERREEEEGSASAQGQDQQPGSRPVETGDKRVKRFEGWLANGLLAEVPPENLRYVIADEFGIAETDLLDELVARAELQLKATPEEIE